MCPFSPPLHLFEEHLHWFEEHVEDPRLGYDMLRYNQATHARAACPPKKGSEALHELPLDVVDRQPATQELGPAGSEDCLQPSHAYYKESRQRQPATELTRSWPSRCLRGGEIRQRARETATNKKTYAEHRCGGLGLTAPGYPQNNPGPWVLWQHLTKGALCTRC